MSVITVFKVNVAVSCLFNNMFTETVKNPLFFRDVRVWCVGRNVEFFNVIFVWF